jgi:hypothetical protein
MSVTSTIESVGLQFDVENGKNAKGKIITREYSFARVNPQATPEVMFKAGNSLASLTGKPITAIYNTQKNLLANT